MGPGMALGPIEQQHGETMVMGRYSQALPWGLVRL